MLGYVHRGQPTMILHSIKSAISVAYVFFCGFTLGCEISVTSVIFFCGFIVFGININP